MLTRAVKQTRAEVYFIKTTMILLSAAPTVSILQCYFITAYFGQMKMMMIMVMIHSALYIK